MSLLVFGRTGQVATELRDLADVRALGRDQVDLSNPVACAEAIQTFNPGAVINAAAYTGVDQAEREEAVATVINGDSPGAMARACTALDIPFVHLSTDYVFAGTGTRAWTPEDKPSPRNAYGRSKLAGEEAVTAAGGRYAVLRTSWVFSAHGGNFVKTMLRLSHTFDRLSVVDDQIGGPTPAGAVAAACVSIADQLAQDPAKSGIYHFSGAPNISWHGFASTIFSTVARDIPVTRVSTNDYPTLAPRPLNSRLDCRRTEHVFGLSRPDWQLALSDVIQELECQT